MDRKTFLKGSGAALMLMSMGVSLQSCSDDDDDNVTPTTPPTTGGGGGGGSTNSVNFDLATSPFDALQTQDAWVLHPDENILLTNVAGDIRAFTSVCTHSACSRNWEFASAQARCTCHGSIFNQSGAVEQGPANSALQEFSVSVDGNTVTITR